MKLVARHFNYIADLVQYANDNELAERLVTVVAPPGHALFVAIFRVPNEMELD